MPHQMYQHCIEECYACAVECSHCATACLREEDVKNLSRCIQLDLECAAFCRSAAEVMSLGSEFSARLCELCAEVCNACAAECERHAEMRSEEHTSELQSLMRISYAVFCLKKKTKN